MTRWYVILRYQNGKDRGFLPNAENYVRIIMSTWKLEKAASWPTKEKAERHAKYCLSRYMRQVPPEIVDQDTAQARAIERVIAGKRA